MISQKNILASTFLFGENMSKIRATAWAYSGGWQRGQLLPPPPNILVSPHPNLISEYAPATKPGGSVHKVFSGPTSDQ